MDKLMDYEYIGDGVYVSHDGFQMWLHVGAHHNPPVVALEPEVMDSLIEYYKRHFHFTKPL